METTVGVALPQMLPDPRNLFGSRGRLCVESLRMRGAVAARTQGSRSIAFYCGES